MSEKEIIQRKDNQILKLQKEIEKWKKDVKKERYGLVWVDVPEGFEKDMENKLPILEGIPEKSIKSIRRKTYSYSYWRRQLSRFNLFKLYSQK